MEWWEEGLEMYWVLFVELRSSVCFFLNAVLVLSQRFQPAST